MNNIITALIIVLGINVLLFASNSAIVEMTGASSTFYGDGINQGGIIEHVSMENTTAYDDLPTSGASVQGDNGNFFTDVVGTILSWIGKVPGFNTIIQTLKAPYNFLKLMHLPEGAAGLIGTFWYLTTLALLFLVITGRY